MGGLGSGGHNKQKHYLGAYRRIDIRDLQRNGGFKKAPSEGFISITQSWNSKGVNTGSVEIKYNINDDFISVVYTIIYSTGEKEDRKDRVYLDSVKLNYGERFYFSCPYCSTRTTTILFHGVDLKCRKCANLNYRSSQESSNCTQGRLNQIDRKIRNLQEKLKIEGVRENGTYCTPYQKPLNMHYQKYTKLRWELLNLIDEHTSIWCGICGNFMQRLKNK